MTGLWPPYSRGLSEEISLSHYLSSAYTEVYSMEYRWKNRKIESIQERRSGSTRRGTYIVVGRNGLLNLESPVELSTRL